MVASAIVDSASRIRASVCASGVLPQPVGADQQDVRHNLSISVLDEWSAACSGCEPQQRTHGVFCDHIVVQHLADLAPGSAPSVFSAPRFFVSSRMISSHSSTFIADEHGRPDQLAHLMLLLPQETSSRVFLLSLPYKISSPLSSSAVRAPGSNRWAKRRHSQSETPRRRAAGIKRSLLFRLVATRLSAVQSIAGPGASILGEHQGIRCV